MGFGWSILAVVGVVLLFALIRILIKMVKEREISRRRKQAALRPLAEDTTITYAGHS